MSSLVWQSNLGAIFNLGLLSAQLPLGRGAHSEKGEICDLSPFQLCLLHTHWLWLQKKKESVGKFTTLDPLKLGIWAQGLCTRQIFKAHSQAPQAFFRAMLYHLLLIMKAFVKPIQCLSWSLSLGEEGVCHYRGCPVEVRASLDLQPQSQAQLAERPVKGHHGVFANFAVSQFFPFS